jgi:hypothetical protein
MLSINTEAIVGQPFRSTGVDTTTEYTCIGYGQDPRSAANYVVGMWWDQPSNRTHVSTFLLKEVRFVGKLSAPKTPSAT